MLILYSKPRYFISKFRFKTWSQSLAKSNSQLRPTVRLLFFENCHSQTAKSVPAIVSCS